MKWLYFLVPGAHLTKATVRDAEPKLQPLNYSRSPGALSSPGMLLLCIFQGFSGICQPGPSGVVLEDFSGLCYYTLPPLPPLMLTHTAPTGLGESAAKEPLVIDDNRWGELCPLELCLENRWLSLTSRLEFNAHYADSVFFKLYLRLSIFRRV